MLTAQFPRRQSSIGFSNAEQYSRKGSGLKGTHLRAMYTSVTLYRGLLYTVN